MRAHEEKYETAVVESSEKLTVAHFVKKVPAISEILRFITELTKARRSVLSLSGIIIIVIITIYYCLLFVFVCCCVSVFWYLAVDSTHETKNLIIIISVIIFIISFLQRLLLFGMYSGNETNTY